MPEPPGAPQSRQDAINSITVIICTYNRASALAGTLRSLLGVSRPFGVPVELVIVDNNSDDATSRVVQEFTALAPFPVRYVFEGEPGKSAALNRAISEAKGTIFVFTDDDVTFDPHWLNAIVTAFEKFDCMAVAGRIIPVWEQPKPAWIELDGQQAVANFDLGGNVRLIDRPPLGASAAYSRVAFEKYGFFRTDLGPAGKERGITSEDTEFGQRLLRAGDGIVYAPGAVVYHPVDASRLNKRYFLRWFYNDGRTSIRVAGWPETTKCYFGVPRWLFRGLAENVVRWTTSLASNRRFHYKLRTLRSVGGIVEAYRISHGRVRRNPAFSTPTKSRSPKSRIA